MNNIVVWFNKLQLAGWLGLVGLVISLFNLFRPIFTGWVRIGGNFDYDFYPPGKTMLKINNNSNRPVNITYVDIYQAHWKYWRPIRRADFGIDYIGNFQIPAHSSKTIKFEEEDNVAWFVNPWVNVYAKVCMADGKVRRFRLAKGYNPKKDRFSISDNL